MSEDNLVNLDNLKTLLKIIKSRRSIRHFKKTPVSGEDIKLLVEAATWAPSACNKQMWEFIYVSEEDIKDKLVNHAGAQPNIKRAPCSLYVTYPSNVTKEGLANIQSASAAIQNLSLCASSMGLGTVWVEACGDPKIVRKILNIPKNQTIISAVCIGYPVMIPSPPQRRRIETVLHTGTFSNKLSGRKRPSDIKEWDENSLINYRSLGIRATSPSRHDFDCAWGADEVEEEAKLTNNFGVITVKIKGQNYKNLILGNDLENKMKFLNFNTGCVMMFENENFDKIGYFDERFFLYFEESDFYERCKKLNKKIYLYEKVTIEHLGGSSIDARLIEKYKQLRNWHYCWSKYNFYLKHKGILIAISKTFPNLKNSIKGIIFNILFFNKRNLNLSLSELSGLMSGYLNLKSYFRIH